MTTLSPPKERPILFNGEMIRALLDGRKTQTRRVIKPQPGKLTFFDWPASKEKPWPVLPGGKLQPCPYGVPGDRLWVRETHGIAYQDGKQIYEYKASWYDWDAERATRNGMKWKPSIHMPRSACRIILEVTDVRVERVQDISEEDAKAEGVKWTDGAIPGLPGPDNIPQWGYPCFPHRKAFERLWDSINKKRGYGWEVNPWIWVVEFKRVES